jgi:hypothetical protein
MVAHNVGQFAGGAAGGYQAGKKLNLAAKPAIRTPAGIAGHYTGMVVGATKPLLRLARTIMGQ